MKGKKYDKDDGYIKTTVTREECGKSSRCAVGQNGDSKSFLEIFICSALKRISWSYLQDTPEFCESSKNELRNVQAEDVPSDIQDGLDARRNKPNGTTGEFVQIGRHVHCYSTAVKMGNIYTRERHLQSCPPRCTPPSLLWIRTV